MVLFSYCVSGFGNKGLFLKDIHIATEFGCTKFGGYGEIYIIQILKGQI